MVACEVGDCRGTTGEVGSCFRADAGSLLRVGTGTGVERIAVKDELLDAFEQGI